MDWSITWTSRQCCLNTRNQLLPQRNLFPRPHPARNNLTTPFRAQAVLDLLKKKVAARGARGILGLGKLFRIMDDDRSGKLDVEEFTKAIKEYKLGVEQSDIRELFKSFDTDKSGQICYEEFLRSIRVTINLIPL